MELGVRRFVFGISPLLHYLQYNDGQMPHGNQLEEAIPHLPETPLAELNSSLLLNTFQCTPLLYSDLSFIPWGVTNL
jgi:hypothetical protein